MRSRWLGGMQHNCLVEIKYCKILNCNGHIQWSYLNIGYIQYKKKKKKLF